MDKYHINPEKLIEQSISYLPKFALAILTLIAGLWVIRLLGRGLERIMNSRNVDEALKPFFKSLVSIVLKVLLLISVMGMIGIEMTSFIALLGAIGISIGMALSGALQNFAGGVLILIYKPFKKGDFIEAQSQKGNVKEIRIFNTVLNTLDNRVVFIPNGPLSTGTIVNFSTESTRRIDMIISVSYENDIDKAKNLLLKLINNDKRILRDPLPLVAVAELASGSVNIAVRIWVNNPDYQDVNFDFLESAKREFEKEGIIIPLPQMEINLRKQI